MIEQQKLSQFCSIKQQSRHIYVINI